MKYTKVIKERTFELSSPRSPSSEMPRGRILKPTSLELSGTDLKGTITKKVRV